MKSCTIEGLIIDIGPAIAAFSHLKWVKADSRDREGDGGKSTKWSSIFFDIESP